jgi:hypothetical protein
VAGKEPRENAELHPDVLMIEGVILEEWVIHSEWQPPCMSLGFPELTIQDCPCHSPYETPPAETPPHTQSPLHQIHRPASLAMSTAFCYLQPYICLHPPLRSKPSSPRPMLLMFYPPLSLIARLVCLPIP